MRLFDRRLDQWCRLQCRAVVRKRSCWEDLRKDFLAPPIRPSRAC